jgi:hypothetical protein
VHPYQRNWVWKSFNGQCFFAQRAQYQNFVLSLSQPHLQAAVGLSKMAKICKRSNQDLQTSKMLPVYKSKIFWYLTK